MNLDHMKQTAIDNAKDGDRYAAICTDGDYEYARTRHEAWTVLANLVDAHNPENRHDFGLVRVDPSPDKPGGRTLSGP